MADPILSTTWVPDKSFSGDGTAVTDVSGGYDAGQTMVIQPDGKILVGGYASNGTNYDYMLVRYNADGSRDTTFDGDGVVTTPVSASDDHITSMALMPDGKIVVGGYSYNGSTYDFSAARYNSDGSLDTTFGIGGSGKVITSIGTGEDRITGITVQPDGKLLVAGLTAVSGTNYDFALARYNANGTLDTSFSVDGKQTVPFSVGSADFANSVTLQADGKIVLAGSSGSGSSSDFALVRLLANGTLDTSFDGDGKVTTGIGTVDVANSVAIQPDGKILVAGYSFNGIDNDFAVLRYNTNGSLDTSFGTGGKMTVDFGAGDDAAAKITVLSDGKILVAGSAFNGNDNDFALIRLNANGTLDTSFDQDGMMMLAVGTATEDFANSVAVQADDGSIVLAGQSGEDIAVMRLASVATSIPDQATAEDSPFNFQVNASTFTDPDGTALTYSATLANGDPLPNWLSFDAATLTFSGTPANGDVGSLSIKVSASDGSASVSDTFSLTVANTNDAPTAGVIASMGTDEDALFSYQVPADTFADVDLGDTLAYSATLANGDPLPSWLSFEAATRTFSGTPENGDVGALNVVVTAKDGSNATASSAFTLTVNNTNDGPTVNLALASMSTNEDALFSYQVPASTFADVDAGDTMTYSATLANGDPLPSWLSFNTATHAFSGTPANGDVGSLNVVVTARDGSNASASSTFTLTVANTNDGPTVNIALSNVSTNEDALFSYQIPANTFADVDAGDTMSYTATLANGDPLPTWLSFNTATRTFSGTPTNGDVGSLNVVVTARDGINASASSTFALTVNNTNDAPILVAPMADHIVVAGSACSVPCPSSMFTDMDAGAVLTYSARMEDGSALPSWLSFDAATGAFTGTPVNANAGTLSIKIMCSDGVATASDVFALTVQASSTSSANVINGTNKSDSLKGTAGADEINGLNGNDRLAGKAGNDVLMGGAGNDKLTGGTGNDVLDGGSGKDILKGESGNDTLRGGLGDDELFGGAGSDKLNGGQGHDILSGGRGSDYFVFDNFGTKHSDHVTDFDATTDEIHLLSSVFSALSGSAGHYLSAASFLAASGATAKTAAQHVLFDTKSGKLYYDSDGHGAAKAQLIAQLDGVRALSANDLFVV
ncbi:MAG: putative Ig domain-containing protein [Burkholderiales bacterium]